VLGQGALLLVGLYFFALTLKGVDLAQVADALRTASIPLLLLALLVGQSPRFTWAVATRAASPDPVPYGAVVLLQLSIPFFNLLAPYTAARMAVNIRFFRRQGVSSAAAVSIGAIDTLGGTVSQILILVVALLVGFESLNIDLQRTDTAGDGTLLRLLLILLVVLAVAAGVALLVPRIRRRVIGAVRPWLEEAGHTLAGVRSPGRLARIIGGNMASEILLSLTLTIIVHAYGQSTSFATLLVVNVGVGLFASFIPIPGGIGVVEGALVVGLTATGVDQSTAVVCALTYRLFTYYLPPIWGWFAYRSMRKRGLF
jgi:uncharacterized membrane protein YbhN (UPF0104 family)